MESPYFSMNMMESTIKIEPIVNELKKEQDIPYNEEPSQEAKGVIIHKEYIEVKSEFNCYLETECQKNIETACECVTRICKAKAPEPSRIDYVSKNSEVKMEEDINYCDEQKIDISEISLGFDGACSLGSEVKVENQSKTVAQYEPLSDPLTSQKVVLKELAIPIPLTDLKNSAKKTLHYKIGEMFFVSVHLENTTNKVEDSVPRVYSQHPTTVRTRLCRRRKKMEQQGIRDQAIVEDREKPYSSDHEAVRKRLYRARKKMKVETKRDDNVERLDNADSVNMPAKCLSLPSTSRVINVCITPSPNVDNLDEKSRRDAVRTQR